MWVLAAGGLVDKGTSIGAGALLTLLFGYLFKELRRKDDGVWQIIADRDKIHASQMADKEAEIRRLTQEVTYWRDRALGVDGGARLPSPHEPPAAGEEGPR